MFSVIVYLAKKKEKKKQVKIEISLGRKKKLALDAFDCT